jgi:hypothetical protein
MFDPLGHLAPLLTVVSPDYAKRQWVRRRCVNAWDKILRYLRSINEEAALHDQVIACLFAAGNKSRPAYSGPEESYSARAVCGGA